MKHLGFRIPKRTKTDLKINDSKEGESIEMRVERILRTGEPITDTAPYIETKAEDGVEAIYDIRADKFDLALEELSQTNRKDAGKFMGEISKGLTDGLGGEGEGEGL